ncbi:substrate-binding domain-containing protein [Amphibacillus indicireducens]|uniref:LacI family DNA-binding transcriptional regulator n=1 Tax=Amphibacillus indicireducens TaxID=1076330 RepID=A0ABP7V1D2_9BACI
MKKNVTMKDIADQIGVSSVTVSKALNDKDGVSDKLKDKIKRLADEMGYRYNTMAKSMKNGMSYNIGIIIPERFSGGISQSVYFRAYQRITTALEDYGYYGIMNILSNEDEEALNLPKIYQEKKVDGFIFLGQLTSEYIKVVKEIDMPIVFLDFYDEHDEIDSVITDNFYGAYDITNYLIAQGHQEIGYVGNLYSTSSIQDRFLGYYKSLLEHQIKLNDEFIINDRDEKGKFIEFNLPEKLPTAFVCNCDQVAHELVNKLNDIGYRVPEDFSVVGFDNDIYATITNPQLTTVDVDVDEMVKQAVRLIVRKIQGKNKRYGRTSVKGNIIKRNSVKKLG